MIRFSRILLSRDGQAENLLLQKDKCTFWPSSYGSCCGISTSVTDFAANDSYSPRGFASYTIYKGKAALTLSPKLPKFSKLDSGFSRMDKSGSIFLEFSHAAGLRKYDWERKQIFALSPTEVGSLISLGSAESCEFMHDPAMKSSLEGQVKKSLSITPLGNSDGGYFVNLNVINTVQKTNERFSVPVSKPEFTVMRTALSYALPHIMGWDHIMRPQTPGFNSPRQQKEARLSPEFEWGR